MCKINITWQVRNYKKIFKTTKNDKRLRKIFEEWPDDFAYDFFLKRSTLY